jgi:hypothetical protein
MGWAFCPESAFDSYDDIERAGTFHAVISRLFEQSGELSGGIAIIREPGHSMDGALVGFSTRHVGEWNFTSRAGQFNVSIGEKEVRDPGGGLHAVGRPDLQGFASIRDDTGGV